MSSRSEEVFLSVVIPAYNEQNRLPDTLHAVTAFLEKQDYTWQVVVVDDGSTDKTGDVVRAHSAVFPQVQLLHYLPNRGKGFAVCYGMTRVRGSYRVFMDADNSTSIDTIAEFMPLLLHEGYDVVVGSRKLASSQIAVHQPIWREWLGDLGSLWIRVWAVPRIRDTQAGFKMFRGQTADSVFPLVTLDGWGFDIEALAITRKQGYQIAEQPIRWANAPDSKVTLKSYFEVLWEVVRVRLNLWRGRYDQQTD